MLFKPENHNIFWAIITVINKLLRPVPSITLIAFFVVLLLFLVLDLTFFHVICSLQDISWLKVRKIVWDRWCTQKGNSYPF